MSSGREFHIASQQSGKTVGVERAEGWELGRRVGTWQRVRGLRSVSGQSRAFCCWELFLFPFSRNCGISPPGMMLIGQAARIGDTCTGIALSFVSRDFGEREVVSACQQVVHKLQCHRSCPVVPWERREGNSEQGVCQGPGGLGRVQRASAVAFCEK